MLDKFSPNMITLVATSHITDPTGDTKLFIPAGTVLKVVSIESDDLAFVEANGEVFPVSLDECKEE